MGGAFLRKAGVIIVLTMVLLTVCSIPSVAAPVIGIRGGFPGGVEIEFPLGDRFSVMAACEVDCGYQFDALYLNLSSIGVRFAYRFDFSWTDDITPYVSLACGLRQSIPGNPASEIMPTCGAMFGIQVYFWQHWRTAMECGVLIDLGPSGTRAAMGLCLSFGYRL